MEVTLKNKIFLIAFLLFVFNFVFSSVVQAKSNADKILKYQKAVCPSCGSSRAYIPGVNAPARTSMNLYNHKSTEQITKDHYKEISNFQRDIYCQNAKKALFALQTSAMTNKEKGLNKNFNSSSSSFSKYFALSFPYSANLKRNTIESSDFNITFISRGYCKAYGSCYALIDTNKEKNPNAMGKDKMVVVILYDGKDFRLEENPGGIYLDLMCGGEWKHLNKN